MNFRGELRPLVVGITGGIATGKSTVLKELQRLGAVVFSADEIARRIVEPGGPAYDSVVEAFGPEIVGTDGKIDRAALAGRVFSNSRARERLESLMHPIILRQLETELQAFRLHPPNNPPVAAAEIPLLYEVGAESLVDLTLVVSTEPGQQFARLKQRTPWPDSQIQAAIDSQLPLDRKRALADHVITTDDGLSETLAQTRAFWEAITQPDFNPTFDPTANNR